MMLPAAPPGSCLSSGPGCWWWGPRASPSREDTEWAESLSWPLELQEEAWDWEECRLSPSPWTATERSYTGSSAGGGRGLMSMPGLGFSLQDMCLLGRGLEGP